MHKSIISVINSVIYIMINLHLKSIHLMLNIFLQKDI